MKKNKTTSETPLPKLSGRNLYRIKAQGNELLSEPSNVAVVYSNGVISPSN